MNEVEERIKQDARRYHVLLDLIKNPKGKITVSQDKDDAETWGAIYELREQLKASPLRIDMDLEAGEVWIARGKDARLMTDKNARLMHILKALIQEGRVDIRQLKQALDVAPPTLRADLEDLNTIFAQSALGEIVQRVHGGAQLNLSHLDWGGHYATKRMTHPVTKDMLGRYLLKKHIRSGDVLALDGGTTIDAFLKAAQQLGRSDFRIVSHSISTTLEASRIPGCEPFMVGHKLVRRELVLVGDRKGYQNTGFPRIKGVITATGVDFHDDGIATTVSSSEIGEMKRGIIENTNRRLFLVFDLSKLCYKSGFPFFELTDAGNPWLDKPIDLTIITSVDLDDDTNLTKDALDQAKEKLKRLEALGEVTVTPEKRSRRDPDFPKVCEIRRQLTPQK